MLFGDFVECYFTKTLDLSRFDIRSIRRLSIADNCCNGKEVTELNLSAFMSIKSFTVGNNCFTNVTTCVVVKLNELKELSIGDGSFTKKGYKITDGIDLSRHFHLRDCRSLQQLTIGDGSFLDYSVCEIVNLPALNTVYLGCGTDDATRCSHMSSLRIRSD